MSEGEGDGAGRVVGGDPLIVLPAGGLRGEIEVPGDKSIGHRALLFAALAKGESRIRGFGHGDDNLRTLGALRRMGVEIREAGADLAVAGKGVEGLDEPDDVIDVGNSGTSIRLLSGLLAGRPFFSVLTGDASLRRRPMGRVVEPLTLMGARIRGREGGRFAPLAIEGTKLKGIRYEIPVASAQVKSALILAGLWAEGETILREPQATRDHTERMIEYLGGRIERRGLEVRIASGEELVARELAIPGDFSAAAFFLVAALIVSGSDLMIRGVGVNPTRTGLIEVLREMGANIAVENERRIGLEEVADLQVRGSELQGVRVDEALVPRMIDEFPILCVAAALAQGRTEIRGARELRVKESDRIRTMAEELTRFGVRVEEFEDGMAIEGRGSITGTEAKSHGDHRVAMALAVAGLCASGRTRIHDTVCIETSFPGFARLLGEVAL